MTSCEMKDGMTLDEMVEDARNTVATMMFNFATDALEPVKIIKSGECTIVFWKDGSKTLVRRDPEDADNLHTAFCAALAKKVHGSNSRIKKIISRKLVENKREKKA